MTSHLYLITAISNMHVGSGEMNFDIVDNQVQRDPITQLPVIHASSLKGAYREAAEATNPGENYIRYIFGSSPKESDAHQPGAYAFFEATLLARPVRSSRYPYCMATSAGILQTTLERIEQLNVQIDEELRSGLESLLQQAKEVQSGTPLLLESAQDPVYIEDFETPVASSDTTPAEVLRDLLGGPIVLLSDEDFKALTLPVIARNYLEDGVSKNLWYEEVVPKNSKFLFLIGTPDHLDDSDEDNARRFDERFGQMHTMHFGANKSIGYGFAKVRKVSL